ncbi:hypothetical protein D9M73_70290 [compost metagenome]
MPFSNMFRPALSVSPAAAPAFLLMPKLKLISRSAVSVKVLLSVRLIVWLMWMSPLPPAVPMVAVRISKLPPLKAAATAAAVMSPVAEIVKSLGSISHLPVLPAEANVVTRTLSATLTWAALVSMKPPSPPLGALASSVPPTLTVPVCISPISRMRPALFCIVFASMTPVLLTVAVVRLSMALADSSTWPPSAWISCLFSASALIAPWSML